MDYIICELLGNLSEEYFPETQIELKQIDSGNANLNFLVEVDGNKYFTKIYRYQSLDRIDFEIKTIGKLIDSNFYTPSIIKTVKQRSFCEIGIGQVLVYEFVDGKEPIANTQSISLVGDMLGKLHLQNFTHLPVISYSVQPIELKQKILDVRESLDNYTADFFYEVIKAIERIPFEQLPKGLAHCDVFLDNMLIDSQQKLFLLDFEEACIENFLFDISRAIIGCCLVDDDIDFGLTEHLLMKYQEHRPLTEIEKLWLPDYLIYCGGISIYWRYYEFCIKNPNEQKKNFYRKLLYPLNRFLKIKEKLSQGTI